MIVRYLPVILAPVALGLVLALAPLETAAQPAPGAQAEPSRPKTAGAPVNAGADTKAVPPGADAREVRPAQAFPPERIARPDAPQAPSRGGVQTPDRPASTPTAPKDDPRSVEEQADPGG